MYLPFTKLNLNDKSDRPHWKIKLTLHDFCFDHNIWWGKFQIFENLPCKGKKTHFKPFPAKLWSQIYFAVYFWREKTSKPDSAHKECPAASKLLVALGLLEECREAEGASTPGMLLSRHGWDSERPPERHPVHRLQLSSDSKLKHPMERLAFNGW